jgi:pilus assembly protein FimV
MNRDDEHTGKPTADPNVDPLAEAEVYLAYDRREQAIQILEEALRGSPSRQDIRKRLAEVRAGKAALAPAKSGGKGIAPQNQAWSDRWST